MEKNKRKVSLNIAGNKISLVTDESPEYVEKLGALVSQRVNTLALSGSGISKMDAALVYALDLLDENFKLKMALAEAKKNNG
ncbi:MAG: cell division protein ZapA [Ruminococcaceae bacterium]|nr:cell division protein ZapA [Oscillospiraceae bacterium]